MDVKDAYSSRQAALRQKRGLQDLEEELAQVIWKGVSRGVSRLASCRILQNKMSVSLPLILPNPLRFFKDLQEVWVGIPDSSASARLTRVCCWCR